MSHPTDAPDAPVPVYVLTLNNEIVREESPEGREALAQIEWLEAPLHLSGFEQYPAFPVADALKWFAA